MITIETQRVLLKGIDTVSFHELFYSLSKEELRLFFGVDESGFEFYQEMHEKGASTFRISQFFFVLQLIEDGRTIGECGFHTWNTYHRKAELYYKLHQDIDKGKGFMSEVLCKVLEFGFSHLNLHRVQALIDPKNIPSYKLLVKNGFEMEGRLNQDYLVNGVFEDSDSYFLLRSKYFQK